MEEFEKGEINNHTYLISLNYLYLDTTSVAEARHNPSIGEGSVGGLTGSLSASGSHMDRIGAIRDNLSETASTMALAGASITGSLSGSAMVNCFNR
jgi:E3 ubiquitin-protein ligase RNF19A